MRNRIDEVLKEQGKTYKDLVPLTGLSEYVIGQMAKAGDDETFGAWLSIARALGVSPCLPVPDQWNNYTSRIPLVTWSTYVYPPDSEDYVERLNASFNSPMEAYKWLAPLLVKYANERRKDEEAQQCYMNIARRRPSRPSSSMGQLSR
nr:MAG TPA: transcriptional regulator [Caudoviricetes sp.]